MSVVEREICQGIAGHEDSKSHCLAFSRVIKNISFAEGSRAHHFLDIGNLYILSLSVYLTVGLFPLKVKIAEPIGFKFCVGLHMTPRRVYGCKELHKLSPKF